MHLASRQASSLDKWSLTFWPWTIAQHAYDDVISYLKPGLPGIYSLENKMNNPMVPSNTFFSHG